MTEGPKQVCGAGEPSPEGAGERTRAFRRDLGSGLESPNDGWDYLAGMTPTSVFGALDENRDKLYRAYQKILTGSDPLHREKAAPHQDAEASIAA